MAIERALPLGVDFSTVMAKNVYDKDADGVVDNSKKLNNHDSSEFIYMTDEDIETTTEVINADTLGGYSMDHFVTYDGNNTDSGEELEPLNADTFGGQTPDFFATVNFVEELISNLEISGGGGSGGGGEGTLTTNPTLTYTGADGSTIELKRTGSGVSYNISFVHTAADGTKTVYELFETNADGTHRITYASVKDYNFKTYTSLAQIGLTSTATFTDVKNALPVKSRLIIECTDVDSTTWNLPHIYGTLEFVKTTDYRVHLTLYGKRTGTTNYDYVAICDATDNIPTGEWTRVMTENISVPKSGGTFTGDVEISKLYRPALILSADNAQRAMIFVDEPENDIYYRLVLRQLPSDYDATKENSINYTLPIPKTGNAGPVYYDILTSENPVTISQGGTGATTASEALTKLGAAAANHKHTASEVGALPISGGILTGDQLYLNNKKGRIAAWTDAVQLAHFTDDDNYFTLSLSDTQTDIKNAVKLVKYVDGNNQGAHYLYGTHNKPTAADVGARPVKHCVVGQNSNTTTNPWYKFASTSISTTYSDHFVSFKVSRGQGSDSSSGILSAHIRQGKTIGTVENPWLKWEYANEGIDPSKFVLIYKHNTTDNRLDVELWAKIDTTYSNMKFEVLVEHNGGNYVDTLWNLYTKLSAGSEADLPSGWTQVVSTFSTIQNTQKAILLWGGENSAWSVGTTAIEVPNVSDYNMLVIRTGTSRNIFCRVLSSAVIGGGISYNTSGGTLATSIYFTRNGNNLTLTNLEMLKLAAGSSPTAWTGDGKNVKEIWGILK